MAEGGLRPPGNFINSSTNPSETSRNWAKWLEQYDFYMIATEKAGKSQEIQVATLLTLLGAQGQEIFRTFSLTNAERKNIETVKKAFTDHFAPQVKMVYERFKFHSRIQRPDETFEDFLTALRTLITTCNFHDDEQDNALMDRIVAGISSQQVREDIFNLPGNPDLDQVIQLCRRSEATRQYLSDISKYTSPAVVNVVNVDTQEKNVDAVSVSKRTNAQFYKSEKQTYIKNCRYCLSSHPSRNCPAYGKTCNICAKKNHFAKACSKKTVRDIYTNDNSHPSKANVLTEEAAYTSPIDTDLTFMLRNTSTNPKEWLLGMATYLSKFCSNLSEVTSPLRELTKKSVTWSWGDEQQEAFDKLKTLVVSSPTLKLFDPDLPLTLSVDSSQSGMGAVLMQEGQPIEFASCSLTDTQKKYAQIEKEFLAVQFGLRRFHQYIYGKHVHVETDHLPLLGIMKKGLNDLSARLLRMRLRNQIYDYSLLFKPGNTLFLADTLSRAFLSSNCQDAELLEKLDTDQIHAVSAGILTNQSFRDKLVNAVKQDPAMQILDSYIVNGWPATKKACIEPLKSFWTVRYDLTVYQDLILRNNQIVIPVSMRRQILDIIHKGHLGISKCIERAKNSVYWPGYQGQIRDLIESCSPCQENMRANTQTSFEPHEIPDYPMQSISMDVFYLDGTEYLVTVDRYSKWPACYMLKSTKSSEIIELLKRQFVDFGRPEVVFSDNASYFVSYEFQRFLEDYGIKHVTASPYHSPSSGLVERMNQTIKSCLTKAKQSDQSLFDVLHTLRNTPISSQLPSPAVLLQSRNLRDNLNCLPKQLKPQHIDLPTIDSLFRERQAKAMFDSSVNKLATEFCVGMEVWCKVAHRKWIEGKIIEHADTPRSFYIKFRDNRVLRKNQSQLRVRKSVIPPAQAP
ncbi:hypothetical protein EB796_015460 [Bugula neritina]|nr:hypothetical protein EB796_015460 [Bugula neritina]